MGQARELSAAFNMTQCRRVQIYNNDLLTKLTEINAKLMAIDIQGENN